MSGIHQFVPMLHRADAVGRHTLRLRDVVLARGIPSHIYVEMDDPETAAETRPFAALRRRGRGRGRAALPMRHGVGPRPLARRPLRNPRRELPQRHAARVLRAVGQRHGAPPAPGPDPAAGAGSPRRARPGGVVLQRGGVAPGRLPPHRRRAPCRHGAHRVGDGRAGRPGARRRRARAPAG